jgi:shikimate kinase
MPIKLFLLGLPGSGKSTVSRHIAKYVQNRYNQWSVIRDNDYDILHAMFEADTEGKFTATEHSGFNVNDLSVCDEALKKLEAKLRDILQTAPDKHIITVEFARDDYIHAFGQFNHDFVQDAYFLFLDADFKTCKHRIHKRVTHPRTPDDHYVSKHIFKTYYAHYQRIYPITVLVQQYGIDEQCIKVIKNNGLYEHIAKEIQEFVDTILDREASEPAAVASKITRKFDID